MDTSINGTNDYIDFNLSKLSGKRHNELSEFKLEKNRDITYFKISSKTIIQIYDHYCSVVKFNEKKEKYLKTGIKNLLKKNRLFRLNNELENNYITEEEFDKLIEEKPDKYIIDLKKINDIDEILVIEKVVSELNEEFTVDEVSEIFSIDSRSFEKLLN